MGQKHISDAIFPARHPRKSSQHVLASAAGDGAICSKNRKIVPIPEMARAYGLRTYTSLLMAPVRQARTREGAVR